MPKPYEFVDKCQAAGVGCKFKVEFVCVHCGKLLCGGPHCHEFVPEPVYRKDRKPDTRMSAVHCPDCVKAHHPFYVIFEPFIIVWDRAMARLRAAFGAETSEDEEPDESAEQLDAEIEEEEE